MNSNKLALALVAILGTGAAIGAYRTGVIGPQYADVVASRPVTVTEPLYADVIDVVLHHHEYLDGSGYPEGLSARRIGRLTRIVTVCDVY